MDLAYKFLVFTFALSIIVFVHEYGHFWVARKNGVKVESFSIGFGPEIIGWTDKLDTRWKFSAIPLGGYVKMYGDADASSRSDTSKIPESERHLTLEGKKPSQRMAVAAAGPFANFIFTVLALCFLFTIKGVTDTTTVIQSVQENSIAERSNIKADDKIIAIDDQKIENFLFMRQYLRKHAGETVELKIERNGKEETLKVDLNKIDGDTKTASSTLGIMPKITFTPVPVLEGIQKAFSTTLTLIHASFSFLFSLLTFQERSAEIGGIITIGDQVSKAAENGIWTLVEFMAMLSLQLGVINLLPVPVLDGGHILMNAIEIIIRRPIHEKVQNVLYKIGLFFVLGLMGYGMFSDIKRYAIVSKVLGLFGIQ